MKLNNKDSKSTLSLNFENTEIFKASKTKSNFFSISDAKEIKHSNELNNEKNTDENYQKIDILGENYTIEELKDLKFHSNSNPNLNSINGKYMKDNDNNSYNFYKNNEDNIEHSILKESENKMLNSLNNNFFNSNQIFNVKQLSETKNILLLEKYDLKLRLSDLLKNNKIEEYKKKCSHEKTISLLNEKIKKFEKRFEIYNNKCLKLMEKELAQNEDLRSLKICLYNYSSFYETLFNTYFGEIKALNSNSIMNRSIEMNRSNKNGNLLSLNNISPYKLAVKTLDLTFVFYLHKEKWINFILESFYIHFISPYFEILKERNLLNSSLGSFKNIKNINKLENNVPKKSMFSRSYVNENRNSFEHQSNSKSQSSFISSYSCIKESKNYKEIKYKCKLSFPFVKENNYIEKLNKLEKIFKKKFDIFYENCDFNSSNFGNTDLFFTNLTEVLILSLKDFFEKYKIGDKYTNNEIHLSNSNQRSYYDFEMDDNRKKSIFGILKMSILMIVIDNKQSNVLDLLSKIDNESEKKINDNIKLSKYNELKNNLFSKLKSYKKSLKIFSKKLDVINKKSLNYSIQLNEMKEIEEQLNDVNNQLRLINEKLSEQVVSQNLIINDIDHVDENKMNFKIKKEMAISQSHSKIEINDRKSSNSKNKNQNNYELNCYSPNSKLTTKFNTNINTKVNSNIMSPSNEKSVIYVKKKVKIIEKNKKDSRDNFNDKLNIRPLNYEDEKINCKSPEKIYHYKNSSNLKYQNYENLQNINDNDNLYIRKSNSNSNSSISKKYSKNYHCNDESNEIDNDNQIIDEKNSNDLDIIELKTSNNFNNEKNIDYNEEKINKSLNRNNTKDINFLVNYTKNVKDEKNTKNRHNKSKSKEKLRKEYSEKVLRNSKEKSNKSIKLAESNFYISRYKDLISRVNNRIYDNFDDKLEKLEFGKVKKTTSQNLNQNQNQNHNLNLKSSLNSFNSKYLNESVVFKDNCNYSIMNDFTNDIIDKLGNKSYLEKLYLNQSYSENFINRTIFDEISKFRHCFKKTTVLKKVYVYDDYNNSYNYHINWEKINKNSISRYFNENQNNRFIDRSLEFDLICHELDRFYLIELESLGYETATVFIDILFKDFNIESLITSNISLSNFKSLKVTSFTLLKIMISKLLKKLNKEFENSNVYQYKSQQKSLINKPKRILVPINNNLSSKANSLSMNICNKDYTKSFMNSYNNKFSKISNQNLNNNINNDNIRIEYENIQDFQNILSKNELENDNNKKDKNFKFINNNYDNYIKEYFQTNKSEIINHLQDSKIDLKWIEEIFKDDCNLNFIKFVENLNFYEVLIKLETDITISIQFRTYDEFKHWIVSIQQIIGNIEKLSMYKKAINYILKDKSLDDYNLY